MRDRIDPGIDRFLGCGRLQVSDHRQAARVRRIGDSPQQSRSGLRIDLDVVHADIRLSIDLGTRFFRSVFVAPVDRSSGGQHPWANHPTRADVFTQRDRFGFRCCRVANGGNAMRQQDLEDAFCRCTVVTGEMFWIAQKGGMRMRVDQSRQQKLSFQ